MQIPDYVACAMTVPLATVATWAACRLRYGRQLKAMQRRLDKLNQARVLYDRHGAQVRRQLEHLKRELDLQRAQQPWAPMPPPATSAHGAAEAGFDAPSLPPDGFAATQPLTAGGFQPTRPMLTDGFAATQQLPPDGFASTRPMPRPVRPARPARAVPPAHNTPRATGMERLRQVG